MTTASFAECKSGKKAGQGSCFPRLQGEYRVEGQETHEGQDVARPAAPPSGLRHLAHECGVQPEGTGIGRRSLRRPRSLRASTSKLEAGDEESAPAVGVAAAGARPPPALGNACGASAERVRTAPTNSREAWSTNVGGPVSLYQIRLQ